MPSLNKQNVVVEGTAPQRQGILMQLLIASFPVLLIILLFMFLCVTWVVVQAAKWSDEFW